MNTAAYRAVVGFALPFRCRGSLLHGCWLSTVRSGTAVQAAMLACMWPASIGVEMMHGWRPVRTLLIAELSTELSTTVNATQLGERN